MLVAVWLCEGAKDKEALNVIAVAAWAREAAWYGFIQKLWMAANLIFAQRNRVLV